MSAWIELLLILGVAALAGWGGRRAAQHGSFTCVPAVVAALPGSVGCGHAEHG